MKSILLIVNPKSGLGLSKKILPKIIQEFQKANFKLNIIESKHKKHIESIISKIEIKEYFTCCIVGGDGSMHEAINGMMNRKDNKKIPLSLIPTGSGNSLARDLNIIDFKEAIKNIISGSIKSMDISEISYDKNKIYSFNIIGWGMIAKIGINSENYRWLGTSRYTLFSLIELIFKKVKKIKLEFYDNNNEKIIIETNLLFLSISNTIHTGKGMKIAPNANINDGFLDLIYIKDASRFKLLFLLPKLFSGKHIKDPKVKSYKISEINILENKSSKLLIDGEIKGKTPLKVKILKECIDIIR